MNLFKWTSAIALCSLTGFLISCEADAHKNKHPNTTPQETKILESADKEEESLDMFKDKNKLPPPAPNRSTAAPLNPPAKNL